MLTRVVNGKEVELTAEEEAEMRAEWQAWDDGAAQRDDDKKTQIMQGVDDTEFMRAFIGLLIDEINLLRTAANLPPRTLTQFKTAMRNKL